MKAGVVLEGDVPFGPFLDCETEYLDFVLGKRPKVILAHGRTENP